MSYYPKAQTKYFLILKHLIKCQASTSTIKIKTTLLIIHLAWSNLLWALRKMWEKTRIRHSPEIPTSIKTQTIMKTRMKMNMKLSTSKIMREILTINSILISSQVVFRIMSIWWISISLRSIKKWWLLNPNKPKVPVSIRLIRVVTYHKIGIFLLQTVQV